MYRKIYISRKQYKGDDDDDDDVCVCVFIKLHITAQSGPVILVILCPTRIDHPKGGSMILITNVCVCVCVCIY